jgi:hypothetical protein
MWFSGLPELQPGAGRDMRVCTDVPMAVDQHTVALKLDLPSREILRVMGSSPGQPIRKDVLDLVGRLVSEGADYLHVRGTYLVRNVVENAPDRLELEHCPAFHGSIAGLLRPATRVALFVVTVGDAIDRLAEQRRLAGREAEGFILHAIGSAAADAACDAMIEHLWANEVREGEAMTASFSPGFCGLALHEQKKLFSIVDTSSIEVSLLPSMMMTPVKSVSGLAGIGPADRVEAHGVPCERCHDNRCVIRRQTDHSS